MKEFESEDFLELKYNVYPISTKEDLLKVFPILNTKFGKFKQECISIGGIDKVLRYIIYCYDQNSPLQSITDYKLKKVTAARLAYYKYDEKKGIIEPTVKKMITGGNFSVNAMIVLFLRDCFKIKWASTVLFLEAYFSAAQEVLDKGYSKDAIKTIKDLQSEIDTNLEQLFSTKPVPQHLQETAFLVMEEEKYGVTPEDIAERIKNGEYIGI